LAQVTITQLPAAQSLTGTESVPISQNGQTVQTTVAAIANSPTQTQTFITVNQESTLPNSRRLQGGTGVGLTDTGALGAITVTLNGVSGSLEVSTNGIIAKTSGSTVVGRTLTGSSTGVTVSNGDGVAGNPVIALTGPVGSINGLSGSGLLTLQNSSSVGSVVIAGTAGDIVVTDGNGLAGNPTISLDTTGVSPGTYGSSSQVAQITVDSKGRITSATDVTITGSANIVGGAANQLLYQSGANTTAFAVAPTVTDTFLKWNGSAFVWGSIAGAGTVTSVDVLGGTTGLTTSGGPITSSGTITLAGTLITSNGGTGLSSYTAGDLLYYAAGTALSKLGIGSSTHVLTSSGTAPQWTDPATMTVGAATASTNIAGGTANQIPYQTGAGATSFVVAPTVANTYLEWSGSAFQWSANPLGSVTSVGLALPAEFTISNSPVTSSGTLTGAWANATENYVFAGPATAPAGTPSFRALVSADIPTLNQNTTGSAASLSISGQTGLLTFTGITSTNRVKTVRDADDTILELGGSYTPSGTWNWTTATATWPTFNQNTTGSAGSVVNAVTFTNTGGASTGTTFDGSVARTIDYSTVGAPKADGTGASGTWGISITGSAGSATDATNVAVTADATNATRYLGFYAATSGNNGTLVDADLTYNPSTNTFTTGTVVATAGISGGTF
jgi:hypothetical protein